MSYHIQLSSAQIHAICEALHQVPPQPKQEHDEYTQQEVSALRDMFLATLQEPESSVMLHGFTL